MRSTIRPVVASRVRTRIAAVALTAAVFGGVAAVAVNYSSPAGALGTTHHLVASSRQNASNAIEGAAKASLSCNDATGKYVIKVVNIQVIRADRVSPWPSYQVAFGTSTGAGGLIPLTQNSTIGLFGGTISGVFANPAVCATGASFQMTDTTGSGDLNVIYSMG